MNMKKTILLCACSLFLLSGLFAASSSNEQVGPGLLGYETEWTGEKLGFSCGAYLAQLLALGLPSSDDEPELFDGPPVIALDQTIFFLQESQRQKGFHQRIGAMAFEIMQPVDGIRAVAGLGIATEVNYQFDRRQGIFLRFRLPVLEASFDKTGYLGYRFTLFSLNLLETSGGLSIGYRFFER
jgi:hypothetical protein